MTLDSSVYGNVGTPRVYVDYIQYAKAIGYVDRYICGNVANFPLTDGSVWDFNPANMNRYYHDGENPAGNFHFQVRFKNWQANPENRQWSRFLGTMNYYGILGHKMGAQCREGIGLNIVNSYMYNDSQPLGESMFNSSRVAGIVGDAMSCGNELGFSLYEIIHPGGYSENDNWSRYGLFFYKQAVNQSEEPFSTDEYLDIGCLTAGRYFDFPFAPDLNVKLNYEYDGIKRARTVGGSDITNITYYKSPQWGDMPPWQHIALDHYNGNYSDALANENYSQVAFTGRRSWTVKFSYVDKTDMIPKSFDGNISGEYFSQNSQFDSASNGTNIKDNFLATFASLSLGGNLKFIFQPDNTKKDFCFCVLDRGGVSLNQTSPGMYDVTLTFVETW
tara:strand:+ start:1735 stop:2901 length:1167 start_codon:yes stop_codon:yes gene_type:complete